jgi:hypothetical protein
MYGDALKSQIYSQSRLFHKLLPLSLLSKQRCGTGTAETDIIFFSWPNKNRNRILSLGSGSRSGPCYKNRT